MKLATEIISDLKSRIEEDGRITNERLDEIDSLIQKIDCLIDCVSEQARKIRRLQERNSEYLKGF